MLKQSSHFGVYSVLESSAFIILSTSHHTSTMNSRTQRLALAVGATALAAYPTAMVASSCIVHPGDTLRDIALRHATTVQALSAVNNISSSAELKIGQMLTIPDAALALPPYALAGNDLDLHTASRDDSVVRIARLYGIDPTALARANGIGVNAPLADGAVVAVPGRLGRMNALLTTIAADIAVNPPLLRAVAWMESGWDQSFISPTGAVGIMQLEPSAGEWVSHVIAHRPLDLHRADDNVTAGGLLLQHLLDRHDQSTEFALAAYYQGEKTLQDVGMYADTKRYVADVSTLMEAESDGEVPLFAPQHDL